MKRDMELIREIMFFLQNQAEAESTMGFYSNFDGSSGEQVKAHVALLVEEGLIASRAQSGSGYYYLLRLTWRGHDYAETLQ